VFEGENTNKDLSEEKNPEKSSTSSR